MKKMKKVYERYVFPAMIFAAVILGMIGYLHEYSASNSDTKPLTIPFLSAVYSTLRLFTGSTDLKEAASEAGYRMILEIARYLALATSGTVLFRLLAPHFRDWWTWFRALRRKSMALHGPVSITNAMWDTMPSYKILAQNSSPSRMKAKTQIVAYETDEETMRFLQENSKALLSPNSPPVYLCVHSPRLLVAANSHIKVSCMAENCARTYWEEHYLCRFDSATERVRNGKRNKILLMGFDDYGEALLSQALLVNVFCTETAGVEYHVFGDGNHFLRDHPCLPQLLAAETTRELERDLLIFHGADDDDAFAEEYADADRIILAEDDDAKNVLRFSFLCKHFTNLPPIHIRLRDKNMIAAMIPPMSKYVPGEPLFGVNYTVFGTNQELYTEDAIIREKFLARAKRINEWYGRHFNDFHPWEKIGTFEQRSNMAAVDHFSVKIRQVLGEDVPMDSNSHGRYQEIFSLQGGTPEFYHTFLPLEHKRWMRFYYLMNWTYAENKDKALRRHAYLKPFDQLEPDIQNLDIDSYKALHEMEL